MRNWWKWVPALLCSVSLASAQTDGTAPNDPASRFGGSLRLPSGTYDPAPRSPMTGVNLPPGAIRLKSFQGVAADTLKRMFSDRPAEFGRRCGEQELIAFPSALKDVQGLQEGLIARPGNLNLLLSTSEQAFRQGDVFSVLTSIPGGYLLASCRLTADKTPAAVLFAPDSYYSGQTPYVIMEDATGQLAWCRDSGTSKQLQAFRGSISRLLLSTDGRLLAVVGVDDQLALRVYDAVNGTLIRDMPLESGVRAMGFSGDGRSLLVQDTENDYTVYDVQSGKVLYHYPVSSVKAAEFQGAGPDLFVSYSSNTSPLRVFDAKTGKLTRNVRFQNVADYALMPGGSWLALATKAGELQAFQTRLSGGAGNLATKPEVWQTLGVRAGARLFPGAAPDEVLAVLFRRDGQKSVFEPWTWRVDSNEVKRLPDVEYRAGDVLSVNPQTRTVAGVRPCLTGPVLRR